jgi:hypothetical protein
MVDLYFLQSNSSFYSTYIDRNIIIGSRDGHKLTQLRRILQTNKDRNNTWLNACVKFYTIENSHHLKLTLQDTKNVKPETLRVIVFDDVPNIENDENVQTILESCNSDIFLMHTFDYIHSQNVLSLQGILLNKNEVSNVCFNKKEYLNKLYTK